MYGTAQLQGSVSDLLTRISSNICTRLTSDLRAYAVLRVCIPFVEPQTINLLS